MGVVFVRASERAKAYRRSHPGWKPRSGRTLTKLVTRYNVARTKRDKKTGQRIIDALARAGIHKRILQPNSPYNANRHMRYLK